MRISDNRGGECGGTNELPEQPAGIANPEESGSSSTSFPIPAGGAASVGDIAQPSGPNGSCTRAHALSSTLFALTVIAAIILLALGLCEKNLIGTIAGCVFVMLAAIEWTTLEFRDPRPPNQPSGRPTGYVAYTLQPQEGISNDAYHVETEIVQ